MQLSGTHNNANMSALQHRIGKYQAILTQYNRKYESKVEPLLQFAVILCENKNYKGAEEILLNIIKSQSFVEYSKLSSIWILRSEIAEELGELQKAVKLFEEAASYQSQPFEHILCAFKAFKLRHSNGNKKKNMNNLHTPKPIPNPSYSTNTNQVNQQKRINKKKKNMNTNTHTHLRVFGQTSFEPSPMPSLPISPILNQIVCTPLTDDFEHFMLESEKKSKHRQKKFEFKSRQKKKQISISASPTPAFMHRNNQINNKNMLFKTALSPIMDVSESNMSLMNDSFSSTFNGPPITPNMNNINNINNINLNMNNSMDNSMNISGLSDISYIGNNNEINNGLLILSPDKNKKPPELPPTTPALRTRPQRFSPPISALQSKPAKRYKTDHYNKENLDVLQITNRFDSIDIDENLLKFQENEKMKQTGSLIRMEVIPLSPSKRKKYGSNKMLSPVRRSKRIQQQKGTNDKQNYQKLLQESNYCYVPNSMLNTSRNKK